MGAITILVGVGQSDEQRIQEVSEAVKNLARGADDRVVLAHVYAKDDVEKLEAMLDVDTTDESQLGAAAAHNTAVKQLTATLDAGEFDLEHRATFGESGDELVELADELEPDFLVVGGRKRSPTGKVVFGSTAQTVLLGADCPVVLVKTKQQ